MDTATGIRKYPFIRITLLFITGIILYRVLEPGVSSISYLILSIVIFCCSILANRVAGIHRKWTGIYGAMIYLFMIISGMAAASLNNIDLKPAPDISKKLILTGHVEEFTINDNGQYKNIIKITGIKENETWKKTSERVLVWYMPDTNQHVDVMPGIRVLLHVRLSETKPPSHPEEFNYKQYLKYNKIRYTAFAGAGSWIELKGVHYNDPFILARKTRDKLEKLFSSYGISGENLAILHALTLGDKRNLSEITRESFASSGAMHLLAVSGLHVGIIYIFTGFMLGFLRKNKWGKILRIFIILGVLWSYAFITGMSPSVMRASLMFSLFVIGEISGRRVNSFNLLAASAFIILLINPFMLFSPGFQLSYLAVLAILMLYKPIYEIFTFQTWIADKTWALISVSLAAQAGTLPLALYYFHQMPIYFIFTNLIAIPMVTIILYLVVPFFALSAIPSLAVPVAWFLNTCTTIMNKSIQYISGLPAASLENISLNLNLVVLIYMLIIFIFMYLKTKRYNYLIISLFTIIFIQGTLITSIDRLKKETGVMICDVRGAPVLNIIEGKQNIVITDSSIIKNSEILHYPLSNYWIKSGCSLPVMLDIKSNQEGYHGKNIHLVPVNESLWWGKISNRRFVFIDGNLEIQDDIEIPNRYAMVVLSDGITMQIEQVAGYFQADLYVIDSSVNYYKARDWINCLEKLKKTVIYVRNNGAYHLSEKDYL